MPTVLSTEDWNDRWEADASRAETIDRPDAFEVNCAWQSSFDRGWCRDIQLRDLGLAIEESQVEEDIIFRSEPASWGPIASFFVAGTMKSCHQGLNREHLEVSGSNCLEYIHNSVETDWLFAGEKIVRVRLDLTPITLNLFGDSASLPYELQPFLDEEIPSSFYRQGVTTPEMQIILQQILHCPYQGAIKQMYLEGKVLELLALQFVQFTEGDEFLQSHSVLRRGDIDRLHRAREILISQLDHPPNLLSLAHQVELNDFKLKQGFRQIFGTTVFGYLRDYRLEQARLLLIEEQLSVQQVAQAIGYRHSGHFAKAFKQKFGISPKAYQLNQVAAFQSCVTKSREC
jgi:AraC-like DNA-binding protein